MPTEEDSKERQNKFPFVASEILSSDIPEIFDLLLSENWPKPPMKIGLKTKLQPPANVEKDDEICLTCPEKM